MADMTAADHANTVREHERFMWGNATTEEKRESSKEFDAALDALQAQAETAEERRRIVTTTVQGDTHMNRLREERDAAVQAAEQAQAALRRGINQLQGNIPREEVAAMLRAALGNNT